MELKPSELIDKVEKNKVVRLQFKSYTDLVECLNILFMLSIKSQVSAYSFTVMVRPRYLEGNNILPFDDNVGMYRIKNISKIIEEKE